VVAFTDPKLERDYLYCKALASKIRGDRGEAIDLGSAVELSHLRLEKTFEGDVSLESDEGEVSTIFSGTGKLFELDEEPLSQIIRELNERFGTDWSLEDRVFYDAVAEKLVKRSDVQQKAAANDLDNFSIALTDDFTKGVVSQLNVSEDMAVRFLDNTDLQEMVLAAYIPLIYGKARVAHQEFCPIGDLLGPDKESETLEYKATLRTHAASGEVYKPLETASLKTLAAFLNSRLGGTLLVGVSDDGEVPGLDTDYASLHKDDHDDRDRFQQHVAQIMSASFGAAAATNITTHIHTIDGHDLARIHVRPSDFPVDTTVTVDRKGQLEKKQAFYIRVGNGTVELTDEAEKQKYISTRWTTAAKS
jgi:type I restriction enzyme R subunit